VNATFKLKKCTRWKPHSLWSSHVGVGSCALCYFCLDFQYPVLAGNFLRMADGATRQLKPTWQHWLPCSIVKLRTGKNATHSQHFSCNFSPVINFKTGKWCLVHEAAYGRTSGTASWWFQLTSFIAKMHTTNDFKLAFNIWISFLPPRLILVTLAVPYWTAN